MISDFTTFGGDDLLWSSSVTDFLDRIDMDVQTYLGTDYFCNLQAIVDRSLSDDCKTSK